MATSIDGGTPLSIARVDLATMEADVLGDLASVGNGDPLADMTGTGDARLFAFYNGSVVAEVDEATPTIVDQQVPPRSSRTASASRSSAPPCRHAPPTSPKAERSARNGLREPAGSCYDSFAGVFGMRYVSFAVLAGAIAGCAAIDPPAPTPREAPRFEAGKPSRGRMIAGERVARAVQWPSADEIDTTLVAALDNELQSSVASAPLPVLLPTALPLEGAKLMHGEQWWALWAQHDGITLTLNASGTAKVYPHLRGVNKPHTVRGVEAIVTQNEAVWTAAWVEHGVAYDLGIECTDPRRAPCLDDARVRELTESLVFAGGRR